MPHILTDRMNGTGFSGVDLRQHVDVGVGVPGQRFRSGIADHALSEKFDGSRPVSALHCMFALFPQLFRLLRSRAGGLPQARNNDVRVRRFLLRERPMGWF
ncbi:hypothetical protein [Paracidovorax avenae]|uniref:hypothetical protein n=1 Tax=Paracidovorax avenae TaxID=80867 RepID=UPI001863A183|nr:hypothetical protein [Paracidovorax avenae]